MKKALLLLILFGSLVACKSTKETLISETKTENSDSLQVFHLQQKLDSAHQAYFYLRVKNTLIEKTLESNLSGTTGQKDTTINIPVQHKRLTSGKDYIDVKGQWIWMDYTWHKAPTTSTHTIISDSASATTFVKHDHINDSIVDQSSTASTDKLQVKENVIRKTNWLQTIGIAIITLVVGLLIGKFLW